jgi:hypothetical protein
MSIYSCKKDKIGNENSDPEALSATEVEILDNLPEATGFNSTSVVLPNGEILDSYLQEIDLLFYNQWMKTTADPYDNLGPQDARNLLIARVSAVALNLTDRSKHQKPDEGTGKPAQNGLAYSWGSKNHTIRQAPPGGGTVCTDKIYGLDCSGFIYQLFTNAGVSLLSSPANQQRQPNVLQSAIKSSIPALNKVKVEDLGKIPTSKFETGDIIYWTNSGGVATHIGIVLKDVGGNLAVFQSNGSPGNSADDCSKNMGLTRGARRLQLNDPYWFGQGKSYGITRINAEISGKWDFTLKCSGATFDFITYDLDFPTNTNQSFQINKTSVYPSDNATYNVSFNFNYDKTTNILSCDFLTTSPDFPSFYRNDYFSQKLTRDEIGFFGVTLGSNQDAGCPYVAKLKNKE